MSLLPSVTGPVQSVEIYVWIIAELASCLRRISPGICTEEGIDQGHEKHIEEEECAEYC